MPYHGLYVWKDLAEGVGQRHDVHPGLSEEISLQNQCGDRYHLTQPLQLLDRVKLEEGRAVERERKVGKEVHGGIAIHCKGPLLPCIKLPLRECGHIRISKQRKPSAKCNPFSAI